MPTRQKSKNALDRTTSAVMSVAKAKANFSSLITGVQKKRGSVTILRRGIPVAKLVPIEDKPFSLYGAMRGSVTEIGDVVGPTGVEWSVGDE
jgi:prevent-host-death family protein